MDIRACLFDVFGTVVDWRTSVSRDLAAFAKQKGIGGIDWLEFAVEWRKLYQPSMDEVRSGRRAFTILDVLHRESLEKLIARYRIKGLSEADVEHMNRAWHRLDPWPDAVRAGSAEDKLHDRALLQRQHRAHGEHGEARRAAVGLHPRRRDRARLQADAGGLSRVVPPARPAPASGDDGRRAQQRSEGGQGAGPGHRVRGAARASTAPARPPISRRIRTCVDMPAADFVELAAKLGC